MLKHRRLSDVLFGALIVIFGLYVAYAGTQLTMGSMSRIGPGFFPLGLGIIMAVLGLATAIEPAEGKQETAFNFRSLIFISLALISFALLVESLGLVPATTSLVILTAIGGREPISIVTLLGTIIGLSLVGYLLFIILLRLPLEPFTTGVFS
ncbi:hypothetical protein LCGC14_0479070 [marine sediment metagenome]|uniref:DUF1468 domain-containing protein n=1 Tax=marine sediment metagenome TaxID=412755 RepID=A0A0F9SSX8_9ZZZZ